MFCQNILCTSYLIDKFITSIHNIDSELLELTFSCQYDIHDMNSYLWRAPLETIAVFVL